MRKLPTWQNYQLPNQPLHAILFYDVKLKTCRYPFLFTPNTGLSIFSIKSWLSRTSRSVLELLQGRGGGDEDECESEV